jgi:short-subunit dehydrogenase involved in D-alanine esterification of teichoic acids
MSSGTRKQVEEETGVEVIELMSPAVNTDMTAELAENGASLITTPGVAASG